MAGTNSIWTVDLAYILRSCGATFTFLTVMEGVRESYETEAFYRDDLDADRRRVEKLFRGAAAAGINVKVSSLSSEELAESIFAGQAAIVLTDRRLLRPRRPPIGTRSGGGVASDGSVSFEALQDGSTFTGHYILLCGFDRATRQFDVRDPASALAHYTVPVDQLDRARTAFGTDEDMLLVSVPGDGT